MLVLNTYPPSLSVSIQEHLAIAAICSSLCGPSDVNGARPAVAAPRVPGPGVHIPYSVDSLCAA